MYENFYRLQCRPFLTAPDPRFMYWTEAHTMAFSMMRYGLMTQAPITMLTGEIGAGKTTLLRTLLREMPDDIVVGLVSNMQPGRGDLLQWVMMALDQPYENSSYVDLFQRFQSFVVDRYAEGKRVALIIDEAQNLPAESLEELRMLSNINADGDDLLQLILIGQPQLRELVRQPELTQFAQRISSDFHLSVMSAADVDGYILHRLQVAQAQWRIFTPEACAMVHQASRGVPRLVNVLCELCLTSGYAQDVKTISGGDVRAFLHSAHKHGVYQHLAPLDPPVSPVRQVR